MANVLGDAENQLIDAVINAPSAWRTPEELAASLDWPLEQTLDVIADLDVAGWLDAWDLATSPAVTLSVAASDRLGVRLVEIGANEMPRWARAGEVDPVGRRATAVFHSERMARLELVADNRLTVEQAIIRQEEAEQAALVLRSGGRSAPGDPPLPRPLLLIGAGLTPWPGPAQGTGLTCPACRSTPLPGHAYCIRCDRSGWDATGLAAGAGSASITVALEVARLDPPRDDSRRREKERKRRQDKRRRRRDVQAKLGRPVSRVIVPLWMAPVAG